MDPLSVTASIVAVLQAANKIISVCYDFRAALRNAPWSLTRVLEEAKDLRSVLETLEQLVEDDISTFTRAKHRPAFELLCEPDKGPLAACLREMTTLESLITSPKRGGKFGSRGRALIQSLAWTLKESDAILCLQRIERCKSTLNLAITADEVYVIVGLSTAFSSAKTDCQRTISRDILEMTTSLNRTVQNIGDKFNGLLVKLDSKDFGKSRGLWQPHSRNKERANAHFHKDDRQRSMLHWLSPLDPFEMHELIKYAHEPGTSNWFLESKDFRDWLIENRSFLWLSAFREFCFNSG
jgi:hypothetical protein